MIEILNAAGTSFLAAGAIWIATPYQENANADGAATRKFRGRHSPSRFVSGKRSSEVVGRVRVEIGSRAK